MKRKFPVRLGILIAVGVVLLLAAVIIFNMIRFFSVTGVYIYADISECANLMEADPHATVSIYENANEDVERGELGYTDYFGCDYTGSDLKFRMFAYTFKTKEDAQEYFYNATGKRILDDDSFSATSGPFSRRVKLTVVDGNRAYRIETSGRYYKEVVACLKECFSVTILEK